MAHASSRAREMYKGNTAVLYVDPAEISQDAPVSTARVVAVGTSNAARSGATLQLVGGVLEADERQMPVDAAPEAPQVVELEPPVAAPRPGRSAKRATRVIAYNVHIVAQDEVPVYDAPADRQRPAQPRMRSHADDTQYVAPRHAYGAPQNAQFEMPQPRREPQARFDMPNGQRSAAMPHAMPREPMPGSIPMSLFGALEGMGGRVQERSRRAAARMQAAAADGSYKEILAQHLNAGRGPLLSNLNMCIAVGAYALILFLLAVFTG